MDTLNSYSPGLANVIACETNVSYLDVEHEEIVIRGYDLIELAKQLTYVDVIGIILRNQLLQPEEREELEQQLTDDVELPSGVLEILKLLPPQTHLMDALRTGISALAGFDEDMENQTAQSNDRRSLRLLGQIPQIVANSYHLKMTASPVKPSADLSYVGNFLKMITKREPTAKEEALFNQVLIVYSEHEMPNSTFAARVIASTQSDIYGAFSGAVASLKGSLHGGANEAVMNMLLGAGTPDGMKQIVHDKLQNKEKIMGFGHRVYMKKSDPRSVLMKQALKALVEQSGDTKWYDMCVIGEEIMKSEKNLYPNLDYYAAPVMFLLGIPVELFTPVFFASRALGLSAHVIEQLENNRLYRPRVLYHGPRNLHLPVQPT